METSLWVVLAIVIVGVMGAVARPVIRRRIRAGTATTVQFIVLCVAPPVVLCTVAIAFVVSKEPTVLGKIVLAACLISGPMAGVGAIMFKTEPRWRQELPAIVRRIWYVSVAVAILSFTGIILRSFS